MSSVLHSVSLLCHLFDAVEMKSSVRASKGRSRANAALPRTPPDCTARLESAAWSEHDLWVFVPLYGCSVLQLFMVLALSLLSFTYIFVLIWLLTFHNVLLCHFAASFLLFAAFFWMCFAYFVLSWCLCGSFINPPFVTLSLIAVLLQVFEDLPFLLFSLSLWFFWRGHAGSHFLVHLFIVC